MIGEFRRTALWLAESSNQARNNAGCHVMTRVRTYRGTSTR